MTGRKQVETGRDARENARKLKETCENAWKVEETCANEQRRMEIGGDAWKHVQIRENSRKQTNTCLSYFLQRAQFDVSW